MDHVGRDPGSPSALQQFRCSCLLRIRSPPKAAPWMGLSQTASCNRAFHLAHSFEYCLQLSWKRHAHVHGLISCSAYL